MPKSKKSATPEPLDLIARLHNLVSLLPTNSQKEIAVDTFKEIATFFSNLHQKFAELPTQEEAENVRKSLSRLEELLQQAGDNPNVAQAFGLSKKAKKTPSKARETKDYDLDIDSFAQALKNLPADKISSSLNKLTVAQIKTVSITIGKSLESKRKAEMINEIARYIEEQRMRDRLAGRTESEWSISDQAVAK